MNFLSKTGALVTLLLGMISFNSHAMDLQAMGEATDFTLMNNQGENVRLEELRGQVVMVNFWASWCGPCRTEMPLMDAIYKKYQKLGFTILAVNVDEDSEDADRFLEQVPVSFPVLYDPESYVSGLYDVKAMPTTLMVDRDGNLRAVHLGYKEGDEAHYEAAIKKLIRE